MNSDDERVLQLALIGLEAERLRIERRLRELRGQSASTRGAEVLPATPRLLFRRRSPNKGKKMSEAQKKKISATMKAHWLAAKHHQARIKR